MSASLPTLDELRARRREAMRAVNGRLLPALLGAAAVEIALFAAIFAERDWLLAHGALLPVLGGTAVVMTAVMIWIVVSWRPRVAAEEVSRHALACPTCGGPVLYAPFSTTRDVRTGRATSYGPRIEDRCTACGAILVSDVAEPGRFA